MTRPDLEKHIVELARRWYHHHNESELAAAVQELEALIKEEGKAES